MSKPFDAALKDLQETYPADWVRFFGVALVGAVEVINADVSTLTAEADKVYRIAKPSPWLLHLEMQASFDGNLGQRMLKYNVLLHERHKLPVRSIVLLLRPQADHATLDGVVKHHLPDGRCNLEFHFDVVRLWKQPVGLILAGGLGTLPLAPLGAVDTKTFAGVMRRVDQRLNQESEPNEARTLRTATQVLMGLRYPRDLGTQLLQGVQMLDLEKESWVVQMWRDDAKAEAKVEEARAILLRQGRQKFGLLEPQIEEAIRSIEDLTKLERLLDRLLEVSSWEELMASRRNGGKKKRSSRSTRP